MASTPDCEAASAWFEAVWAVLFADSTAPPGALCAVAPPASTGAAPSAGAPVELSVVGAVDAGAAVSVRWPCATFVKRMSVPCAARSSCTSRLGMSTPEGMALPRRTISA